MGGFYKLIGVIRSIKSDHLVNGNLATNIQSLVSRYRNLAYEPKQVELIKLIDKSLKNRVVNEAEHVDMLKLCNEISSEVSSESAKISELNGIVYSIIVNSQVNELGLYRLKDWMDHYGSILRGNKHANDICKIIDDILLIRITEKKEELVELIEHLSERISTFQFESKLEYLKKQIKAKKNIGIYLIDLLDNENALDTIHRRAEFVLKQTFNSYTNSVSDPEIVFISLVLTAMVHYDGNFYKHVRETYKTLYRMYSDQKIEGLIRSILSKYLSEEKDHFVGSRLINIALANAIVPGYYLKSFFEFIYDIYKLNFEYTLSDDLYEDFMFVYEGLRSNMLSDGDDVKVNVTKKTYKLIKSTKQLILSKKNIDAVIKLSIIVANIIDKEIWDKDIQVHNPYLKRGFLEWIELLRKEEKVPTSQKKRSEFRSRWEPKYLLLNNEIYIDPPIHRVKAQYDYRDITVVIKNGEQIVYFDRNPDIREIIGGYQVSVSKVKVSSPLGEIKYQLLAGEEIIYDSKERMYRQYIVFDQEGSEISNNSDYSGTAVFCLAREVNGLTIYHVTDKYVLAFQNVSIGEAFVIEDSIFSFSSLVKPGVFGEVWDNHFLSNDRNDEKIPVYKYVKQLFFESNSSTKKFEVIINDKPRRLEDLDYSIAERNGIIKYLINLDFINTDGVYTIQVNALESGKKKNILSLTFAIDEKLCSETVKINDESYLVSISSGLFQSLIVEEININSFQEDWMTFNHKGENYTYFIPFAIEVYRLNGGPWSPINKEIFIEDIDQDSIIEFYGEEFDEIQVLSSGGEILVEPTKLKRRDMVNYLHVGFLISYKVSYDYTALMLIKDGKVKNALYCYNKCVIDKDRTKIRYDLDSMHTEIVPVFYGKGLVYFDITDSSGNSIFISNYLKNGVKEFVKNLEPFEKYEITFYEKEKGLSLKKNRILKSYIHVFYTLDSILGKSFRVKEVQFDQYIRGKLFRKNYSFYTTYLRFSKRIAKDRFIGELYAKTRNGLYMLNRVNPVEIEICSDIIDGTLELAITKDGDGLLLDFKHRGVMNSMDDATAIDIFSYIIDLNGVEEY
jgi:hypothetical protein